MDVQRPRVDPGSIWQALEALLMTGWKCASCGYLNRPGRKHCASCSPEIRRKHARHTPTRQPLHQLTRNRR